MENPLIKNVMLIGNNKRTTNKTRDISDPFLCKLTKTIFSNFIWVSFGISCIEMYTLKWHFFKVKRTKGYFFDIISNWKWLSVEIGYIALLVAFDIPSEFDVLLAACGWCRAAVPPSPPHSTLMFENCKQWFLNLHYRRKLKWSFFIESGLYGSGKNQKSWFFLLDLKYI